MKNMMPSHVRYNRNGVFSLGSIINKGGTLCFTRYVILRKESKCINDLQWLALHHGKTSWRSEGGKKKEKKVVVIVLLGFGVEGAG